MTTKPYLSVLKNGLFQGALAGGILSFTYTALVIPATGLVLIISNIPGGKAFDALLGAGFFAICAWPFGIIIGIIPGVLFGAVGGFLVGLISHPFINKLSRVSSTLIGFGFGLLLAGIAHYLIFPGLIDQNTSDQLLKYLPYLFWLAFPSLLSILGYSWVGWKIHQIDSKEIT